MKAEPREIKFRYVWRCDVCHRYSYEDMNLDQIEGCELWIYNCDHCDTHSPCSLIDRVQYIGLKEKNLVEIYEGDVIENRKSYAVECPDVVGIGIIVWTDFYWAIDWIGGPEGDGVENYLSTSAVIGNIYENPELLEPGTKL